MRDYRPQADKTSFEKVLQAFAQTPVGGRLFISVFPAIDRRLIPLTRGRLSTGLGQPIVLLHARGAKSGVERTTPLLATKQHDLIILVASKAGATSHPAWFHTSRPIRTSRSPSTAIADQCARSSRREPNVIGCGPSP